MDLGIIVVVGIDGSFDRVVVLKLRKWVEFVRWKRRVIGMGVRCMRVLCLMGIGRMKVV